MKVIAFNGSPRKDGNTAALIRKVFEPLEDEGIETQMIQLGGNAVRGCIACYQCFDSKDCLCAQKNDMVNDCIAAMRDADAIILASPTYFADITPELKALIDRSGLVARANGNFLRRKVGAAVVAVRRAGAIHAFDSINHFFLIGEMIVPGSTYWNISIGRNKGEVADDEEGMATMATLGQNIAWLLKKIAP
ncbi:MAG: flavodoxin family protein [Planctomycetaceae bacterium]|nr:flavodoxin family protein [Planctomycetaceae bacterium]